LVDGLDEWLDRLKGPPHKCAAVFVDNSGIDIVLGVLPFARELLQRGTKVIVTSTHIIFTLFFSQNFVFKNALRLSENCEEHHL
jgi:Protein of unknown function DUF89.